MDPKPCRDCGSPLDPSSRGCTTCALNLKAEAMIDRFVWRIIAPGLLVLVALVVGLFVYARLE